MGSEKHSILIADDEADILEIISHNLQKEGYQVYTAQNGEDAVNMAFEKKPNLIILDVMMPRKDGFSLAQDIRSKNKEIPIIFLTAKTLKEDVLKGYQVGADDYLNKPFDSEVLLFKIKAILQRKESDTSAENEQFEFNIGGFFFNSKLRHLSVGEEEPQKLSPKESKLLRMLALHKNDLMPRELALTKIWRDDNYFTSRSMDVYIAKLRKYLKNDDTVEILNIHGEGFRLVDKN
mgnify:CR=1 FL=1